MTLGEIFKQLTYGELSQLSMGGSEGGRVRPEDYERVTAHVNMALKALYRRFFLSAKEAIIDLYPQIQTYTLDRRFAVTNAESHEPILYVIDSIYEPFENDVLKIEQVFNEGGELLFLNDRTQPWSVFTPAFNKIQIPYPCKFNSMLVQYRASHPEIKYPFDDVSVDDIHVDVPDGLIEPLLFYVGHRAYGAMNTDDNQEGNNYLQKYENACQEIERQGLYITDNYSNLRLDDNGWI